jgi:hypothetical protein
LVPAANDVAAENPALVTVETTYGTAVDLLARKPVAPPYTARNEWFPAERATVLRCAVPFTSRAPMPRLTTPSINVTAPVAPAGVTPALSVTVCPNVDAAAGLMLVSVVVVVTWALRTPENKRMAPTVVNILGILVDLFIGSLISIIKLHVV